MPQVRLQTRYGINKRSQASLNCNLANSNFDYKRHTFVYYLYKLRVPDRQFSSRETFSKLPRTLLELSRYKSTADSVFLYF